MVSDPLPYSVFRILLWSYCRTDDFRDDKQLNPSARMSQFLEKATGLRELRLSFTIKVHVDELADDSSEIEDETEGTGDDRSEVAIVSAEDQDDMEDDDVLHIVTRCLESFPKLEKLDIHLQVTSEYKISGTPNLPYWGNRRPAYPAIFERIDDGLGAFKSMYEWFKIPRYRCTWSAKPGKDLKWNQEDLQLDGGCGVSGVEMTEGKRSRRFTWKGKGCNLHDHDLEEYLQLLPRSW